MAVLLAYALLLQAMFGGYASVAMAGGPAGFLPVICSADGTATGDSGTPAPPSSHDGCPGLCHLTCAAGTLLPGGDPSPAVVPASRSTRRPVEPARPAIPAAPGLLAEARAPPALSLDA